MDRRQPRLAKANLQEKEDRSHAAEIVLGVKK